MSDVRRCTIEFYINKSIIKEVCGETSYKRGEAYYKSNKVIVNYYDETKEICEATVKGNEDFRVTVEKAKKVMLLRDVVVLH